MLEASIEAVLLALEERLLRAEVRQSPEELDLLLADEFREFGSSGRILDKPTVLRTLRTAPPVELSLRDFHATALSPDCALCTYIAMASTLEKPVSESLRSSVWRRKAGRWQVVFHQGTRIAAQDR